MLPITWRGNVTLGARAGEDPERIVDRLVSALTEVRAASVQRELGAVVFKGGPFRLTSNWNLLASISSGRVEIVRGSHGLEAHYQLSFAETVYFFLVGLGFMILPMLFVGGTKLGPEPFVAIVVGMLLVVGFRVGSAIDRFSTFVKRVVFTELPQRHGPG